MNNDRLVSLEQRCDQLQRDLENTQSELNTLVNELIAETTVSPLSRVAFAQVKSYTVSESTKGVEDWLLAHKNGNVILCANKRHYTWDIWDTAMGEAGRTFPVLECITRGNLIKADWTGKMAAARLILAAGRTFESINGG